MMSKEKNTLTIVGFLLQAGFFTFLGGLVMFYLERDKDFDLEERTFQYQLIKDGLSIDNQEERDVKLKLYYDVGLLDSTVIAISKDSLSYKLTYLRGKSDGVNTKSIVSALKSFYKFKNQAPKSLKELSAAFTIEKPMAYFESNVHYLATGPKKFDLIFPGTDGVLFTKDDQRFDYESLHLE